MEDKEQHPNKIAPIGKRPTRPQNKGYGDAGASFVKKALKGFLASSGSPHEDIDNHQHTLRQRARMLYMASPVATSAIKTNRTNVIGCGLQLKSRANRDVLKLSPEEAREWQRKTEAEFEIWAANKRNCDALGINNFYSVQGLLLASSLLSGDVMVIVHHKEKTTADCPYGLRFQALEADRISTPSSTKTSGTFLNITEGKAENGNTIYDGVEVDKGGAIVAYHVSNNYPRQATTVKTEWTRVEAYGQETGLPNILHIMEAERPEQYRGVSYLAQVIEPLLQMRRYTDSELVAAVVTSFFTAFVVTEEDPSENPLNEVGGDGVPEVSRDPNEYEMGPGQVNFLKKGESVVFGDPKRPSSGFEPFLNAVCKQVGAALEIPVEELLKAFNSSYSASRAALLEAWKAFKMRREWFVDDFCRPIYEIWLYEAVARGRIRAPGFFSDPRIRAAWLGSEWIGPSQGQIDPVKEIQAEELACKNGFSTREQSTIRLGGGDYEANAEQLQSENALLNAGNPAPQQPATTEQGQNDVVLDALAEKVAQKLYAKIHKEE